jgi:phosphatidylinositol alpha-1,6-mannosyltransferase
VSCGSLTAPTDMQPTVLFVSKPIAPPFHDGTKCLVRDLALGCREHHAVVMGVEGDPATWAANSRVEVVPAYAHSGSFAPTLGGNLRAARWLATRAPANLWHFVFAPNPRTSCAGRWLSRWRGAPVVQTVASPPRDFRDIDRLLFGDVVVAQSDWTKRRILENSRRPGTRPLEVIPPPVPEFVPPSSERVHAARHALGIPAEAPLFVYPGDLEHGVAVRTVESIVEPVLARLPGAVFVFAYRAKTRAAPELAHGLRERTNRKLVRVTGDVADILGLLAGATAVLFPVDDLWGKVDLPIVLLESMALGVPVVAFAFGPLCELGGILLVSLYDRTQLVEACVGVAENSSLRGAIVAAEQRAIEQKHQACIIARQYERVYATAHGHPSSRSAPA